MIKLQCSNVMLMMDRLGDTSLRPLPRHHVDTEMGLERVTAVLQGTTSNYITGLFQPLFDHIHWLIITLGLHSSGKKHTLRSDSSGNNHTLQSHSSGNNHTLRYDIKLMGTQVDRLGQGWVQLQKINCNYFKFFSSITITLLQFQINYNYNYTISISITILLCRTIC